MAKHYVNTNAQSNGDHEVVPVPFCINGGYYGDTATIRKPWIRNNCRDSSHRS